MTLGPFAQLTTRKWKEAALPVAGALSVYLPPSGQVTYPLSASGCKVASQDAGQALVKAISPRPWPALGRPAAASVLGGGVGRLQAGPQDP